MTRSLLFLYATMVSVICCATSIASPTFPHPSATLAAAVGDTQVAHSFPFSNDGDKPITITAIKTSCGCTTAKLDKTTYAPGESGNITATFVIGDRTGEQTKHIRVHWREGSPGSDSGASEQVTTLTMKGRIRCQEPYIDIAPRWR